MSRRFWTMLGAGLLSALLLIAVAVMVFLFIKNQRNLRYLHTAETAFARQDWKDAKRNFAWYLTKHPRDTAALENYAEASSKIFDGRTEALRDVARAYFQIATGDPENKTHLTKLLEFNQRHRLWNELEYCTQYFLRLKPDDVDLKYYRGMALERQGRAREALDVYDGLVQAGTDRLDVYGDLAVLQYRQGLVEQASKAFELAREKFPDDARVSIERARYLLQTRQLDAASAEIAQAVAVLPENADARMTAAQIAIARKQWDEALAHLLKAQSLAPVRPDAYLGLAYVYETTGASDKGIALLEGLAPEIRLDSPEILFSLAEMQYSQNRLDEARVTVESYRHAYPEQFSVFEYFEGREFLQKGSPAEAVAKFNAVAKSSPDSLRALFYQAAAYLQLKQNDQARTAIEAYLRSRPDDEAALELMERLNKSETPQADGSTGDSGKRQDSQTRSSGANDAHVLAQKLASEGRPDEAGHVLQHYADANASDPDAWTNLGAFYLSTRDRSKLADASTAFTRALVVSADHVPALRGMIQVQLLQGNAGTGLGLCERYLAVKPNNAEVLHWQARLLAQDPTRLEQALDAVNRAIRVMEQPEFFTTRGQILLAQGNFKAALDDFRRIAGAQAVAPAEIDAGMAEAYAGLKDAALARQYLESAKQKAAKDSPVDFKRIEQLLQGLETDGTKP